MLSPQNATDTACIGTGLIGGSWAATFLAAGMNVSAFDPSPGAEKELRARLDAITQSFPKLAAVPDYQDKLQFTASLEEAVGTADYIQESGPEDVNLRKQVISQIDAAAKPDAIIGSSTSAQPASSFTEDVKKDASRVLVAHPFNPVHLMPLVELVPGPATSTRAAQWARAFHERLGKTVLLLDREVGGFVANRLQEAIWREALHMMTAGEASAAEIDMVVRTALAPRWMAAGPCMGYHLAWGQRGITGLLDMLGGGHPGWARLDPPPLTDQDKERILGQFKELLGGKSEAHWSAKRDKALLRLLKNNDMAAD